MHVLRQRKLYDQNVLDRQLYLCKVYYCIIGHSAPHAQIYISTTSPSLVWLIWQSRLPPPGLCQCFLSCIVTTQPNWSLILCWPPYPPPAYNLAAHKSPSSELEEPQPTITNDKVCVFSLGLKERESQEVRLYICMKCSKCETVFQLWRQLWKILER